MKELKGLFKLCAGCSHMEKMLGPKEGRFYCNSTNEIIHCSRDAMNCEHYDGKNVTIPFCDDLPQVIFD